MSKPELACSYSILLLNIGPRSRLPASVVDGPTPPTGEVGLECFLELLEPTFGVADESGFVGFVVHAGRFADRAFVRLPKELSQAMRLFATHSESFQGIAREIEGGPRRLNVHVIDPSVDDLVSMHAVENAREDAHLRVVGAHPFDDFGRFLGLIERKHQHARLRDSGRLEQLRPLGIAVKRMESELAEQIDLIRVVVEHRHTVARRTQDPRDHLSKPANSHDEHRILALVDGIGLSLRS